MFRASALQVLIASAGMNAARDGETSIMILAMIGMITLAIGDLFFGPKYEWEKERPKR